MTDGGLLLIAAALYFGLKALAAAVQNRKIEVTVPGNVEWNLRLHDKREEPRP